MSQNPYVTLPSSSSLSPSTSTGQDFHPSWTQAHLGSSHHMSKAWQAVLISKQASPGLAGPGQILPGLPGSPWMHRPWRPDGPAALGPVGGLRATIPLRGSTCLRTPF